MAKKNLEVVYHHLEDLREETRQAYSAYLGIKARTEKYHIKIYCDAVNKAIAAGKKVVYCVAGVECRVLKVTPVWLNESTKNLEPNLAQLDFVDDEGHQFFNFTEPDNKNIYIKED